MGASMGQKAIAAFVLLVLQVVMFVFSPVLGILAFLVLLPGLFAVWRL